MLQAMRIGLQCVTVLQCYSELLVKLQEKTMGNLLLGEELIAILSTVNLWVFLMSLIDKDRMGVSWGRASRVPSSFRVWKVSERALTHSLSTPEILRGRHNTRCGSRWK